MSTLINEKESYEKNACEQCKRLLQMDFSGKTDYEAYCAHSNYKLFGTFLENFPNVPNDWNKYIEPDSRIEYYEYSCRVLGMKQWFIPIIINGSCEGAFATGQFHDESSKFTWNDFKDMLEKNTGQNFTNRQVDFILFGDEIKQFKPTDKVVIGKHYPDEDQRNVFMLRVNHRVSQRTIQPYE